MSRGPLLLVLLSGLGVISAQAQDEAKAPVATATLKATVEGAAIDDLSKQPLAGVKIQLFRADPETDEWDSNNPTYTTETDTAGRFRFEHVEPGKYALDYSKPHYYRAPIVVDGTSSWPQRVTVKPGETLTDLRYPLAPAATVSGHVLDEDRKPVRDAQVMMPVPLDRVGGKRAVWGPMRAKTNEQGEYRAEDLSPGQYYLLALPPKAWAAAGTDRAEAADAPREAYVPTYASNALEVGQAAALTLRAGQELTGHDIVLRKAIVADLRGKAVWEDGTPAKGLNISLGPQGVSGCCTPYKLDTDERGEFTLQQLLPGDYHVFAFGGKEFEHMRWALWQLHVGERDMDLTLRMEPINASGAFVVQGYEREDNYYEACEIIATSISGEYLGTTTATAAHDGTFKLEHLAGGKVTLQARCRFEDDTYVQSILVAGVDVLGEEADSAALASGGIRVIMRGDAAHVSGSLDLPDRDHTDLRKARGYLIPTDARLRRAHEFGYLRVDRNGHFQSGSVRPGEYLAVVFDHLGLGGYGPEEIYPLMEGKGQRITLAPGESKTISLKLLPWPAEFADRE